MGAVWVLKWVHGHMVLVYFELPSELQEPLGTVLEVKL